jgi:hypothetical protein
MALTRKGRKLLVASVGVAAVSYVACGGSNGPGVVANLMIIPNDGGTDATADVPQDKQNPPPNWDVIANLVPPPRD